MSEKTLFQKIGDREIPAQIVFEDESCFAFRDINPQAPTHILICPRRPISGLDDVTEEDRDILGHILVVARQIAEREGLERGYRAVLNCGPHGQQTVPHLHVHLIGGRQMNWPPG